MTMTKTPSQSMEFHELNPEKGIINIGSHPENDIVVQDPRIMPFHMMLDLRDKPYHVIGLSPEANIEVNGVSLQDGETKEVFDLNQVRFCGYALNLRPAKGDESGGQIALVAPEFPAAVAPAKPEAHPGVDPAGGGAHTAGSSPALPILQVPTSDTILVEIQERTLSIDVEQTAVYPITIVNGGAIVASFEVHVEGVPAEWVKIAPDRVNLNEGGRAGVEVQITPPRSSDSRAGVYPVLIKVSSPNYPGQVGGVRAELTVNPFYEFTVGNLSPRYKSVSWQKQSAITQFPITNQGNSLSNFLVMAQDDENGCHFEFQVQDEVSLVKQAEVAVKPGETRTIPIRITPQKRNLVRLRPRQYSYSITTQSMNESAASRIVSGTFVSRPLFGLFSILLAMIIMLVGSFFILRPRIIDFHVTEDVIALGEPAILNWKVSPFTTSLRIEGVNKEISGSQNQVEVVTNSTAATYTLVAGNWLSRLLRMEDVRSKPIMVLAIPPSPQITTFFVDKTRIFQGDNVTIKWSVADAEEAFLTVDGVRGALKPEEFNGERAVTLRNNSLIVLEAKNASGSKFRSEFIHAQKPTIVIEEFSLSKTQIIKGEPVTIKWKVSGIGVENVQISPFEEVYPLEGELTFFPEASMEFVLTIKNRDLEEIRLLPIGVLEPGAEPKPPTVEFFKVAPEEIVGSGTVEFSWSVSGQFDRIEITNLEGVVVTGLPAQGFKALDVKKTTSFVLTAYNGNLSSAAILEVKVNETKKNVIVVIDKILPSTSIYRGDSVTVYYSVTPATKNNVPVDLNLVGWPEVSGSVVVTDGYDTCKPVDLPSHACVLTLNTSEYNKKITATYSGDDNYVRRTSDPFPVGLDVVGASSKFTSFSYSLSTVVVGQTTNISFQIAPEDPTATIPISGKVNVVEGTTTHCIATLAAVVGSPMSAKGECMLSFATVGNKFLTLKYEGNDIYDGKTASMPMLVVNQAGTNTTLASNWLTPTVVGEPKTIQFAVVPLAPGKGVPTGQVVIKDKNEPSDYCVGTLDTFGRGICKLALNHFGTREIVGSYAGDANYILSHSASATHVVIKASTTTTLTSFEPSTTSIGQEVVVKYLVKVVSPGSGSPTGNVTVTADNGDSCTGTINAAGQGQCAVLLKKAGSRSFKVSYSGDASYEASETSGYTYTVTQAHTTTSILSHSPNPSAVNELVEVKFSVESSLPSSIKPDGTVTVVASSGEFCDASVSGGLGSCNLKFVTEGRRNISVMFLGSGDYMPSSSTSVIHNVKKASVTSIVSVTPTPSTVDQSVDVKFSVIAATGGGDSPSGSVTVTADTGETCVSSLSGGTGSCQITFSSSNTKSLIATYNGDLDYKVSTSSSYSITVSKATTATVITTDLSTATQVGENVKVAFEVTSIIATKPTGSVTVNIVGSVDPNETCTATLTNGAGSCTLIPIQAGISRPIQAVYAGTTDRFTSSTSTIVNHTVNPAATTVEILSDLPNPSMVGELVTFQVRVRANTLATLMPGGSFVIKLADDTTLCNGVLDASSEGSCTFTFNTRDIYSIKAVYTGSADFVGSTSGVGTHHVIKSDSTTTVTISPSPSALNQEVTVSVTAASTGLGSGIPTGSVSVIAKKIGYADKVCSIAGLSSGSGSCKITLDAIGDWMVTADYSGDSNFNGSQKTIKQTVEKISTATTVTVTPVPSVKGQSIDVKVTVAQTGAGSGVLGGSVSITATKAGSSDKTCTITDISSGSGNCSVIPDSVGDWMVTAVYFGNGDFSGSSASISHTVEKLSTTTTVSSITPVASVTGQAISVLVNVNRSGAGSGTPDGNVLVTATTATGGSVSCPAAIVLSSGSGSCNLTLPTADTWTIKADYQGSGTFNTSSGSKVHHVNPANTTTTVSLSPTSSVVGQSITVNLSVTANSPGSGTPTGKVNVSASRTGGGVETCAGAIDLSSGSGSCTLLLPTEGTWTVSGNYQGDANYNLSTGVKTITVSKATTSLAISGHTPSSSVLGDVVMVLYDLTVVSPGSGTPTGLVTVKATTKYLGTDYETTCTGDLGRCELIFSQTGVWKLSAFYPGDSNFKSAISAVIDHTVNNP